MAKHCKARPVLDISHILQLRDLLLAISTALAAHGEAAGRSTAQEDPSPGDSAPARGNPSPVARPHSPHLSWLGNADAEPGSPSSGVPCLASLAKRTLSAFSAADPATSALLKLHPVTRVEIPASWHAPKGPPQGAEQIDSDGARPVSSTWSQLGAYVHAALTSSVERNAPESSGLLAASFWLHSRECALPQTLPPSPFRGTCGLAAAAAALSASAARELRDVCSALHSMNWIAVRPQVLRDESQPSSDPMEVISAAMSRETSSAGDWDLAHSAASILAALDADAVPLEAPPQTAVQSVLDFVNAVHRSIVCSRCCVFIKLHEALEVVPSLAEELHAVARGCTATFPSKVCPTACIGLETSAYLQTREAVLATLTPVFQPSLLGLALLRALLVSARSQFVQAQDKQQRAQAAAQTQCAIQLCHAALALTCDCGLLGPVVEATDPAQVESVAATSSTLRAAEAPCSVDTPQYHTVGQSTSPAPQDGAGDGLSCPSRPLQWDLGTVPADILQALSHTATSLREHQESSDHTLLKDPGKLSEDPVQVAPASPVPDGELSRSEALIPSIMSILKAVMQDADVQHTSSWESAPSVDISSQRHLVAAAHSACVEMQGDFDGVAADLAACPAGRMAAVGSFPVIVSTQTAGDPHSFSRATGSSLSTQAGSTSRAIESAEHVTRAASHIDADVHLGHSGGSAASCLEPQGTSMPASTSSPNGRMEDVLPATKAKRAVASVPDTRSLAASSLKAWSAGLPILLGTPILLHGANLQALHVMSALQQVPAMSSTVLHRSDMPFALRRAESVLHWSSRTAPAGAVLASALPLSSSGADDTRLQDLVGPHWDALKQEDDEIVRTLVKCAVWEDSQTRTSGREEGWLPVCDLLHAVLQQGARVWSRARTGDQVLPVHGIPAPSSSSGACRPTKPMRKPPAATASLFARRFRSPLSRYLVPGLDTTLLPGDGLSFDPDRCGRGIRLANRGRTAIQGTDGRSSLVLAKQGFQPGSGHHAFSVFVKKCSPSGVVVGVATAAVMLDAALGQDPHGWGVLADGGIVHDQARHHPSSDLRVPAGSTVRVTVNTDDGCICFRVAGNQPTACFQSPALAGCGTRADLFFPAVSLQSRGDEVELLGCAFEPAFIEPAVLAMAARLGLKATDQALPSRDVASQHAATSPTLLGVTRPQVSRGASVIPSIVPVVDPSSPAGVRMAREDRDSARGEASVASVGDQGASVAAAAGDTTASAVESASPQDVAASSEGTLFDQLNDARAPECGPATPVYAFDSPAHAPPTPAHAADSPLHRLSDTHASDSLRRALEAPVHHVQAIENHSTQIGLSPTARLSSDQRSVQPSRHRHQAAVDQAAAGDSGHGAALPEQEAQTDLPSEGTSLPHIVQASLVAAAAADSEAAAAASLAGGRGSSLAEAVARLCCRVLQAASSIMKSGTTSSIFVNRISSRALTCLDGRIGRGLCLATLLSVSQSSRTFLAAMETLSLSSTTAPQMSSDMWALYFSSTKGCGQLVYFAMRRSPCGSVVGAASANASDLLHQAPSSPSSQVGLVEGTLIGQNLELLVLWPQTEEGGSSSRLSSGAGHPFQRSEPGSVMSIHITLNTHMQGGIGKVFMASSDMDHLAPGHSASLTWVRSLGVEAELRGSSKSAAHRQTLRQLESTTRKVISLAAHCLLRESELLSRVHAGQPLLCSALLPHLRKLCEDRLESTETGAASPRATPANDPVRDVQASRSARSVRASAFILKQLVLGEEDFSSTDDILCECLPGTQMAAELLCLPGRATDPPLTHASMVQHCSTAQALVGAIPAAAMALLVPPLDAVPAFCLAGSTRMASKIPGAAEDRNEWGSSLASTEVAEGKATEGQSLRSLGTGLWPASTFEYSHRVALELLKQVPFVGGLIHEVSRPLCTQVLGHAFAADMPVPDPCGPTSAALLLASVIEPRRPGAIDWLGELDRHLTQLAAAGHIGKAALRRLSRPAAVRARKHAVAAFLHHTGLAEVLDEALAAATAPAAVAQKVSLVKIWRFALQTVAQARASAISKLTSQAASSEQAVCCSYEVVCMRARISLLIRSASRSLPSRSSVCSDAKEMLTACLKNPTLQPPAPLQEFWDGQLLPPLAAYLLHLGCEPVPLLLRELASQAVMVRFLPHAALDLHRCMSHCSNALECDAGWLHDCEQVLRITASALDAESVAQQQNLSPYSAQQFVPSACRVFVGGASGFPKLQASLAQLQASLAGCMRRLSAPVPRQHRTFDPNQPSHSIWCHPSATTAMLAAVHIAGRGIQVHTLASRVAPSSASCDPTKPDLAGVGPLPEWESWVCQGMMHVLVTAVCFSLGVQASLDSHADEALYWAGIVDDLWDTAAISEPCRLDERCAGVDQRSATSFLASTASQSFDWLRASAIDSMSAVFLHLFARGENDEPRMPTTHQCSGADAPFVADSGARACSMAPCVRGALEPVKLLCAALLGPLRKGAARVYADCADRNKACASEEKADIEMRLNSLALGIRTAERSAAAAGLALAGRFTASRILQNASPKSIEVSLSTVARHAMLGVAGTRAETSLYRLLSLLSFSSRSRLAPHVFLEPGWTGVLLEATSSDNAPPRTRVKALRVLQGALTSHRPCVKTADHAVKGANGFVDLLSVASRVASAGQSALQALHSACEPYGIDLQGGPSSSAVPEAQSFEEERSSSTPPGVAVVLHLLDIVAMQMSPCRLLEESAFLTAPHKAQKPVTSHGGRSCELQQASEHPLWQVISQVATNLNASSSAKLPQAINISDDGAACKGWEADLAQPPAPCVAVAVATLRQLMSLPDWRPAVVAVLSVSIHNLQTSVQKDFPPAPPASYLDPGGISSPAAQVQEQEQRSSDAQTLPQSLLESLSSLVCQSTRAAAHTRALVHARGQAALDVLGSFQAAIRPGALVQLKSASRWEYSEEEPTSLLSFDSAEDHLTFDSEPLWADVHRASSQEQPTSEADATLHRKRPLTTLSPTARLLAAQQALVRCIETGGSVSSSASSGPERSLQLASWPSIVRGGLLLCGLLAHPVLRARYKHFDLWPDFPSRAPASRRVGYRKALVCLSACVQISGLTEGGMLLPGRGSSSTDDSLGTSSWARLQASALHWVHAPVSSARQPVGGELRPLAAVQPSAVCIAALCSAARLSLGPTQSSFVISARDQRLFAAEGHADHFPPCGGHDQVWGQQCWGGGVGVDESLDIPPPCLGLGRVLRVEHHREGGGTARLVTTAAPVPGHAFYTTKVPSHVLQAVCETACRPCDVPTELVQSLVLSLLPLLLRSIRAGKTSEEASPSSGLSGSVSSSEDQEPRGAEDVSGRAVSRESPNVTTGAQSQRGPLQECRPSKSTGVVPHQYAHAEQCFLAHATLKVLVSLLTHPAHLDAVQRASSTEFVALLHSLTTVAVSAAPGHGDETLPDLDSTLMDARCLLSKLSFEENARPASGILCEFLQGGDSVERRGQAADVGAEADLPPLPPTSHRRHVCPLSASEEVAQARPLSAVLSAEGLTRFGGPGSPGAGVEPKFGLRTALRRWILLSSKRQTSHTGISFPHASSAGKAVDGTGSPSRLVLEAQPGSPPSSAGHDSTPSSESSPSHTMGFAGGLTPEIGESDSDDADSDFREGRSLSEAPEHIASRGPLGQLLRSTIRSSIVGAMQSVEHDRHLQGLLEQRSRLERLVRERREAQRGQVSADAIATLEGMGFKRQWCEFALLRQGGRVSAAVTYILENMDTMDLQVRAANNARDGRLEESGSTSSRHVLVSAVRQALSEMGFPPSWAERAVRSSGATSAEDAVSWALANAATLPRAAPTSPTDSPESTQLGVDQHDAPSSAAAGVLESAGVMELPSVALAYTPGQQPNEPVSSQPVDSSLRSCVQCLCSLGSVEPTLTLRLRSSGISDPFASFTLPALAASTGRWYYEAVIVEKGITQIGWATPMFSGSPMGGMGVGDDLFSWAWDGVRQCIWHEGRQPWGLKWSVGDVVCCAVDVDRGLMHWGLNGSYAHPMGLGFAGIDVGATLFPALSLQGGAAVQLRLGEPDRPFLCGPPPGFCAVATPLLTSDCVPFPGLQQEHSLAGASGGPPLFQSVSLLACTAAPMGCCLDVTSEAVRHRRPLRGPALLTSGGSVFAATSARISRHFGRALGQNGSRATRAGSLLAVSTHDGGRGPLPLPGQAAQGLGVGGLFRARSRELVEEHSTSSVTACTLLARRFLTVVLATQAPAPSASAGIGSVLTTEDGLKMLRLLAFQMGNTLNRRFLLSLADTVRNAAIWRQVSVCAPSQYRTPPIHVLLSSGPINSMGDSAGAMGALSCAQTGFVGGTGSALSMLPAGLQPLVLIQPQLGRSITLATAPWPACESFLKEIETQVTRSCQHPCVSWSALGIDRTQPPETLLQALKQPTWSDEVVLDAPNPFLAEWLSVVLVGCFIGEVCQAGRIPPKRVCDCRPLLHGCIDTAATAGEALESIQAALAKRDGLVLTAVESACTSQNAAQTEAGSPLSSTLAASLVGIDAGLSLRIFGAWRPALHSGSESLLALACGVMAALLWEQARVLRFGERLHREIKRSEGASAIAAAAALQRHVSAQAACAKAHMDMLPLEELRLVLESRLEEELPSSPIHSRPLGSLVNLFAATTCLESRLASHSSVSEEDVVRAALAAALIGFQEAHEPACGSAQFDSKEEEREPVTGSGGLQVDLSHPAQDGAIKAGQGLQDSAMERVRLSLHFPELDDGLPGRSFAAANFPEPRGFEPSTTQLIWLAPGAAAADASNGGVVSRLQELADAPWRVIASGAGSLLRPGISGACAPVFLASHTDSSGSPNPVLCCGTVHWGGNLELKSEDAESTAGCGIFVGAKVVRGPALSDVGVSDADGRIGTVTIVTPNGSNGFMVCVEWRDGVSGTFRWGVGNLFDVQMLDTQGELVRLPAQGEPLLRTRLTSSVPSHSRRQEHRHSPSQHSASFATTGATVRLAVVPFSNSAPTGWEGRVGWLPCGEQEWQRVSNRWLQPYSRVRVAGTLELPSLGGAVVALHGYWQQVRVAVPGGLSTPPARRKTRTPPQKPRSRAKRPRRESSRALSTSPSSCTDESDEARTDPHGATMPASQPDLSSCSQHFELQLVLQEVELLRGSAESGWEQRFGHPWFRAGTVWKTTLAPLAEQVGLISADPDGNGPQVFEARMPRQLELRTSVDACDQATGSSRRIRQSLRLSTDQMESWGRLGSADPARIGGMAAMAQPQTPRGFLVASKGFTSGVHYWEVCLDQLSPSSTLLLGVYAADSGDSSGEGLPTSTSDVLRSFWGLSTKRTAFMQGSKVPFGETMQQGDVVGLCLDVEAGTLAFFLDGMRFGEHTLAELGALPQRVTPLNGTALRPRVYFPALFSQSDSNRVTFTPKTLSVPRALFGTGLQGSLHARASVDKAGPASGMQGTARGSSLSTSYFLCSALPQEQVRVTGLNVHSTGAAIADIGKASVLLQCWGEEELHRGALDLFWPATVPAKQRKRPKRSRSGAEVPATQEFRQSPGLGHDFWSRAGGAACADHALADLVLAAYSKAVRAARGTFVTVQARGSLCVSISQSQARLAALLQHEEVSVELTVGCLCYLPRITDARGSSEMMACRVLGTAHQRVWFRPEPLPSQEAASSSGGNKAWFLSTEELHRVIVDTSTPMLDSECDSGAARLLASGALASPRAFASAALPAAAVPLSEDLQLIQAINTACQSLNCDCHALPLSAVDACWQESTVGSGLEPRPMSRPLDPLARALVLMELGDLAVRVAALTPLSPECEPGFLASCPPVSFFGNLPAAIDFHSRSSTGTAITPSWRLTSLASILRSFRCVIPERCKLRLWSSVLSATTHPTHPSEDEYGEPRSVFTVRISRGPKTKPEQLARIKGPSARFAASVSGQLMRALRGKQEASLRQAYVGKGHGGQARAFLVKFVGEGVDDHGGPYRALFDTIADELQAQTGGEGCLLPALAPSAPTSAASPPKGPALLPSCETWATSLEGVEAMVFIGRVIGIAIRSGMHVPLALQEAVWSALAYEAPGPERWARASGAEGSRCLSPVSAAEAEGGNLNPKAEQTFHLEVQRGVQVELVEGGARVPVTAANRDVFTQLARAGELGARHVQVSALAQGLASIVPHDLLPLWSGQELRRLVCGLPDVTVSQLQRITSFGEGLDGKEPHIQWLWEVLGAWDAPGRVAFLRFVAARSSLPATGGYTPMSITISQPSGPALEDPDAFLPKAQTCFFSLILPAYSSKDILEAKMHLAVHHCPTMDADVVLHSAEGWSGV